MQGSSTRRTAEGSLAMLPEEKGAYRSLGGRGIESRASGVSEIAQSGTKPAQKSL